MTHNGTRGEKAISNTHTDDVLMSFFLKLRLLELNLLFTHEFDLIDLKPEPVAYIAPPAVPVHFLFLYFLHSFVVCVLSLWD